MKQKHTKNMYHKESTEYAKLKTIFATKNTIWAILICKCRIVNKTIPLIKENDISVDKRCQSHSDRNETEWVANNDNTMKAINNIE